MDSFERVKTIELGENEIRQIIVGTATQIQNLLYSQTELVLVKYLCRYHLTPSNLVERFNNQLKEPDYDNLIEWLGFISMSDSNGFIFTPHLDDKYYEKDLSGTKDYLFDDDDHIVSFVVRLVKESLKEKQLIEDLKAYINFINEVISQRNVTKDKRQYSKETLSLILQSISYETYRNKSLSDDCLAFYHENLLRNAQAGDNQSMRSLGYEYYEGTCDFPCDAFQACYWLEKYYKATEDPDVARTLGYIYYYGRTTNGVPQGDKAFQYFAIGHLGGGFYEATYKLADCYIKGYGTPINHQCAYNLVNSIYQDTRTYFLNGNDSKFADVALRLGSYYKDGIYVQKDLLEAQQYYLEAKVTIKKRLEHMEYVGDREVAIGISKSLKEIQKELDIEKRIVKSGGYLIDKQVFGYDNRKFKIEYKNGYIHVVIKQNKNNNLKYQINMMPNIGFAEVCEQIEFFVKTINPDDDKNFVESIVQYDIKQILFADNKFYAVVDMKEKGTMPAFTTFEELIFVPQTLKDISKQFAIVSVEFYPGSKTYEYLSTSGKVSIGDRVKISANGETKEVLVKKIELLHEDKLPLPLEKMAKI